MQHFNLSPTPTTTTRTFAAGGFALIEAIVAVSFIITITVVLFGLLMETIKFNTYAKEQTQARYLLQDLVELIVAKYQYNIANSAAKWYLDIGDNAACVTERCTLTMDYESEPYTTWTLRTCSTIQKKCQLWNDLGPDWYTPTPQDLLFAEPTPYYRYVTIFYEDFDANPATYEAITYTVTLEWFQDQATTTLSENFTLYHP